MENIIGLIKIPPLFHELESSIIILVSVIAIDYITGICKAIYNRKLNSIIGIKGIIRKIGYLLIAVLSYLVDALLGDHTSISTLVITFFVANEGISILENWSAMGLPLPKKIFDLFEQMGSEKNK